LQLENFLHLNKIFIELSNFLLLLQTFKNSRGEQIAAVLKTVLNSLNWIIKIVYIPCTKLVFPINIINNLKLNSENSQRVLTISARHSL